MMQEAFERTAKFTTASQAREEYYLFSMKDKRVSDIYHDKWVELADKEIPKMIEDCKTIDDAEKFCSSVPRECKARVVAEIFFMEFRLGLK